LDIDIFIYLIFIIAQTLLSLQLLIINKKTIWLSCICCWGYTRRL